MLSKAERGMTLIELIVAMVILSVGVSGVLVVFSTTTRNSADPMLQKQMVAAAEGMMEEIQRMPYAASANDAPSTSCARDTFNNLADYNDYGTSDQVCDVLGNQQLNKYSINVSVVNEPSNKFTNLGVVAGDVVRITVRVGNGTSSVTLVGWRTDYAKMLP